MKLKTGDTVSVLNEKAEGVITKVIAGNLVLVSIEGMEYSYSANELVFVSSKDATISEKISEKIIENIIAEKDKQPTKKQSAKNSLPFAGTEEVDLHIAVLLEDTAGMSASEKLNYQLNVFRKKLDECISNNCRKIIFIHGVGTGVLRSTIRKIIDEEYENVTYCNASMSRFGMGATEVKIK